MANHLLQDRVRAIRKSLKLSQKALGELCDLSQQTINDIESGRNKGSAYIVRLALALEVDPTYLAEGVRRPEKSNAASSTYQVKEWGDRNDLNLEEYEWISVFNVEGAAGHGIVADGEEIKRDLPFRKAFLEKLNITRETSCIIYVRGESMEPMLHAGDIVLIDTRQTQIIDNKIYAIISDDDLRIKMVERRLGGGMLLKSLNKPLWQDQEISEEDLENGTARILGRVVYQSGER